MLLLEQLVESYLLKLVVTEQAIGSIPLKDFIKLHKSGHKHMSLFAGFAGHWLCHFVC